MTGPRYLSLSGWERELVGCIVTAREQATGELWTLYVGGRRKEALLEICDRLDAAEGDWRVATIATPVTIYTDLQITRRSIDDTRDVDVRPEPVLLAAIGRHDLLEPRSNRVTAQADIGFVRGGRASWRGRGRGPNR